MKKTILIISIILAILAGGFFIIRGLAARQQAELIAGLETFTIQRGNLTSTVDASGTVRSNQSAILFWEVSGEVGQVHVNPGDRVSAGDVLASLKVDSLPSYIILAQADLLSAQKALDDLHNSQLQQASALKAVDEAEKSLEDALNPELSQAQAQAAVADANKNLETARRNYEIITTVPPQSAIDQAYANLVLAEDQLNTTKETIADLEQQIKTAGHGLPPVIREKIRQALIKALKGMQIKLTQDQLTYERSLSRYNALLEPPDPIEVGTAEAELITAKAQLEDAKRQWERIKDGTTPGDIAVLEARLEDAQREWERVKDGPDPDDITTLEARIAAAEASIRTMEITAPFDGTITAVDVQPGDQVSPGTLAFRLDDVSKLMIDVGISEIDINQIKNGLDAIVTFDSVFAREYKGRVVETALVGSEVMGLVNFEVTVELDDPDSEVKPGMTSDVKIVVNWIEDALIIPNQAIRSLNGERVVYVLDRSIFDGESPTLNNIQAIPLTLGTSSNNYSEVLTGNLKPGDEVLITPPNELINPSQGSGIHIEIAPPGTNPSQESEINLQIEK